MRARFWSIAFIPFLVSLIAIPGAAQQDTSRAPQATSLTAIRDTDTVHVRRPTPATTRRGPRPGVAPTLLPKQARRTRGATIQTAQQCPIPEECGGGTPAFAVTVVPDNASASYQNNLSGLHETFSVRNTGTSAGTYSLSCSTTENASCSGVSPSSVYLPVGSEPATVTATFSTSAVGSANLTVSANGPATGSGTLPITVIANPAPTLSLTPHGAGYRAAGACVANCFDFVFGHSTPAFYTMDFPRSFGVIYNSSTARSTPAVFVDVTAPSGIQRLQTYSIQLQNSATSAYLTLLNGANIAYYTAQAGQTLRLAAVFDAAANGLTTGATPINIIVTANYSAYGNVTSTSASRVLIDNEAGSAFGAGVTVSGLQRIYFQSGSSAVTVTEGGGSIAFYNRTCPTCTFSIPGGSTAGLTDLGSTLGPDSTKYERKYLDGTIVGFRTDGRLRNIRDRFGNKTLLTWTDTLLTQVTFPKSKSITLAYTTVSGVTKLASVTDAGGRITRYTIDASRRLTGIMDPDSVSQSLAYVGASVLPTTATDRSGISTTIAYDGLNRVSSATGPSVTLFDGTSAQPVGRQTAVVTSVWQPAITGTTAGTPKGAIRADTIRALVTDPAGRVTQYELDRFGMAVRVKTPDGLETLLVRDTAGRVTLQTSPRYRQVGYSYSGFLLTQQTDYFTGVTTRYYYNVRNDVDSVTGGPVKVTNYYHNGTKGPAGAFGYTLVGPNLELSGMVHLPNSEGRDTAVYSFMTWPNPYSYSAGSGQLPSQRVTFDPVWGNVASSRDQISRTSSTHYDAFGRPDTLTNPMGKKSTMTYDVLGRVVSSRDPQGRVVTQGYDARGLVQRVVDPKGQVYRWRYDVLGRSVAQFDLADTLRADSSYYDLGGALRKVRTRSGDLLQLSYDAQGRLTQRSASGMTVDTVRFANDGAYQVLTNGVAYDSVNFDIAGRPTTSVERIMGTSVTHRRTYDQYSRVTGRVLTSGLDSSAATYTYTARGQFSTVCVSGLCASPPDGQVELGTTGYTYNPSGTPWGREIGRSVGAYTYPVDYYMERGMPLPLFGATDSAQFEAISSAWSVQSLVIEDEAGSPYKRYQWQAGQNYSHAETFSYDSAGQLLGGWDSVTSSYLHEVPGFPRYTYDQAGNRTDEGAYPFVVPGTGNRYLGFHGWSVRYDLNGRVTSRAQAGDSLSYSWNALGQLVEVKRNGASLARFGYDPTGRRVWKAVGADTTRFYHDGGVLAFDVGENGRVQQEYAAFPASGFIYGIKNSSWSGIVLDEQSSRSTLRVVDYATGHTEIKKFSYTPYGVSTSDSGKIVRQRFAGAEFDQEAGVYMMGARYYDPLLGRFLSEDPIGIQGGLNLYTYAANNPVSMRDPSGLDPDPRCDPGDGGGQDSQYCQEGDGRPWPHTCANHPGTSDCDPPNCDYGSQCYEQEYYSAMDYMDFLGHASDAYWAVASARDGGSGQGPGDTPQCERAQANALVSLGADFLLLHSLKGVASGMRMEGIADLADRYPASTHANATAAALRRAAGGSGPGAVIVGLGYLLNEAMGAEDGWDFIPLVHSARLLGVEAAQCGL